MGGCQRTIDPGVGDGLRSAYALSMARRWHGGVVVMAVVIASLAPPIALACLWDRDTLAAERARRPGVLSTIAGNFPRHSEAYYRWRVRDRETRLEANGADLSALDDLVVAFDKLGDSERAVATARRALALDEDRYESQANLGTVLIHQGRWREGLSHIRRAIAINPDAHFGREVVQERVVEYVLERRIGDRVPRPLSTTEEGEVARRRGARVPIRCCELDEAIGFASFLHGRPGATVQATVEGLLGMMRFGDHRSPILLEALGDVLLAPEEPSGEVRSRAWLAFDARQLAAMAYLRAGELMPGPHCNHGLCRHYRLAIGLHDRGAADVRRRFRNLRRRAAALERRIERDERRWIAGGHDVDALWDRAFARPARRQRARERERAERTLRVEEAQAERARERRDRERARARARRRSQAEL